ncbi:hypothetical protein [Streptomyces collinus]|uniref:hypothetical protein n=1 Tax=Streptomyces collinus TaxID=42684 RepID=UPI0036F04B62
MITALAAIEGADTCVPFRSVAKFCQPCEGQRRRVRRHGVLKTRDADPHASTFP